MGKKKRAALSLAELPVSPEDNPELINVVVETPKGCRNKFAYVPEAGTFLLKKVLPAGMEFPHDFGFVPSTKGPDGDPLDVLILMDESAYPGCLVRGRLIGVIEGEQTKEKKSKKERNDRLLAVAEASHNHSNLTNVKNLNKTFLKELESFLMDYHKSDGVNFRVLGCRGPGRAKKLVEEGRK